MEWSEGSSCYGDRQDVIVGRGCGCPFFFFNDTATTEIYTLSLHDALPIYPLVFEIFEGCIIPTYNSELNACTCVIMLSAQKHQIGRAHV